MRLFRVVIVCVLILFAGTASPITRAAASDGIALNGTGPRVTSAIAIDDGVYAFTYTCSDSPQSVFRILPPDGLVTVDVHVGESTVPLLKNTYRLDVQCKGDWTIKSNGGTAFPAQVPGVTVVTSSGQAMAFQGTGHQVVDVG